MKQEIFEMYDKGHSVISVARELRKLLPPHTFIRAHEISQLLKQEGLFRSHSETMKAISQITTYSVECVSCHTKFEALRSFTKYCKLCAPDSQAWFRLANYGLTKTQFETLLKEQGGCCAICQRNFDDVKPHRNKATSIVVDHNHESNTVRGLLCNDCNVSLGHLEKHSPSWIQSALTYIGKAAV